jgi:hypothetical protein
MVNVVIPQTMRGEEVRGATLLNRPTREIIYRYVSEIIPNVYLKVYTILVRLVVM